MSADGKYYSPVPIPPGDRILDIDLHSSGPSWVVLSVPCAAGRCAQVARSSDSGRTWHRLPVTTVPTEGSPPARCPTTCPINKIRFVNALDGYLFSGGLYLTRDGGSTWHNATPPAASVYGIAAVGAVVVRITSGWCNRPMPTADSCRSHVEFALPGTNTWRDATVPDLGYPAYGLTLAAAPAGGAAYVLRGVNLAGSSSSPPLILHSTDGASWNTVPDPCLTQREAPFAVAASGSHFALECIKPGGDGSTSLRLSADAGATFSTPMPTAVTYAEGLVAFGHILVQASGPVGGNGAATLSAASTQDNGAHWRTLATPQITITALGASSSFTADENGDLGWVVTPFDLWLSHDQGQTWTQLSAKRI